MKVKQKQRMTPVLRYLFLMIAFLLGSFPVFSQDGSTGQPRLMTLKQCISYASNNHVNIKTARLDAEIARARVKEFVGVGLPQVSGSGKYQYFIQVPKSVIDITKFPSGEPIPPNLPDNLRYQAAEFALPHDVTAGFSASQLLFDGSFFVGVQASRELVKLTERTADATRIDIAANVSKAYYNALVAEERSRILEINVDRVEELLNNTRAFYKEGFVEQIDVDRLEISYNNLLTEQEKVERYVVLSKTLLKFQMGMDLNEEIILADRIEEDAELPPLEDLSVTGEEHTKRVEYDMLSMQYELQRLNAKRYRMGRFGTLAAFGGWNIQAIRPEFNFFDPDWDWYPNSLVGVQYNINLFDGLRTPAAIKQVEFEMDKIKLQQENFETAVSLEVKSASVNVQNAWSNLQSNERNMELAKKVSRISEIKYKEGVGSNLEVLDAETTLREAQTNYLSALYEYQLALIDLKKAKGELLPTLSNQ